MPIIGFLISLFVQLQSSTEISSPILFPSACNFAFQNLVIASGEKRFTLSSAIDCIKRSDPFKNSDILFIKHWSSLCKFYEPTSHPEDYLPLARSPRCRFGEAGRSLWRRRHPSCPLFFLPYPLKF